MSTLESVDKIEAIIGAPRHACAHLARAVSKTRRVYVLHSAECKAEQQDLRACVYSVALDRGIDLDVWREFENRAVIVHIGQGGRLEPVRGAA